MLWIALNFPQLPLEAFPQLSARLDPWATSDGGKILVCNPAASARGVRPGMKLSAACALTPDLNHRARDLNSEVQVLEEIAQWAGQYTPSVSLQPPSGLLLEIEGSLKLLGGIKAILASIRHGCAHMGYTVECACAPTVAAAWLLARAGTGQVVSCKRLIESTIAPLPVTTLDCTPATREILAAIGAQSIADVLRLPREGVARRGGRELHEQLDRALGVLPEARRFYTAPPRFKAALELATEVTGTEALLFAIQRLITQLAGYLSARCAGVQHFNLMLSHSKAAPTAIEIGLVTPTRDAQRLLTLVRDRLAAHQLAAPVCRIGLEALDILALCGESGELLSDHTCVMEDWTQLVERLQARLGTQAVSGLAARSEHRPHRAWERTSPGTASARLHAKPRPLWLLEEPRPLAEIGAQPHYKNDPLALITGPERIESGWWDECDMKRDYFVARAPDYSTLWIYRERRRPGGWYLHGIFG